MPASLILADGKQVIQITDDHRKPVGATQDHPTVAIIAHFAIDFLNDWGDD